MSCKILNLVDLSKSDFEYSIYNYPDSEKHIVLHGTDWNKHKSINVVTRIASMDDLFILLQVKQILQHERVKINTLTILYLLGARCDRRFSLGEAIDANIIQSLIGKISAEYMLFLDPHSINKKNFDFISSEKIGTRYNLILKNLDLYRYNICYPDEGAARRYSSELNPHTACLIGEKHRKPDGISISLTELKLLDTNYPILVIDDLCDGGGTFAVLANELNVIYPDFKREIWVTHAIQKSGIELLASKYNKVYITNSYKNWENENLPENVTVIDVTNGNI